MLEELIKEIRAVPPTNKRKLTGELIDKQTIEGADEMFALLVEKAKERGITVKQDDKDPGWEAVNSVATSKEGVLVKTTAMAFSISSTKLIVLPEVVPSVQRFHSTVHELGHLLVGDPLGFAYSKSEKQLLQMLGLPPQDMLKEEMIAETTVYLVFKALGLETKGSVYYLRDMFDMDYMPWDSENKLRQAWAQAQKGSELVLEMLGKSERQAA